MGKPTNTFVSFLTLLGVKHTKSFSDKYFNEHPHQFNLYGLSKMLSDYRICNSATQIEDKENVCIQYIFSAFNKDLEYANRYFIAAYLEKGSEAAWQLYSEWFEKGKALKKSFFHGLNLDMTNPAIEVEFQKHESWKAKMQLRATPTILVNGYKLPENYKIEDLRYFTKFDVNIK